RRGNQDSYGWLAVMDMGNRLPIASCGSDPSRCPRIIAAAKVYDNPATRWCGLHNTQLIPGPGVSITPHAMLSSGGLGLGTYVTALTAGVSAGQTSISVSGEPASNGPSDPALPKAQAGDWFKFEDTGEHVLIMSKNSPY